MIFKQRLTALLLIATISYTRAIAQKGDTLELQNSKYNIIKLARFKSANADKRKMQNAQEFLYKILDAKADDELLPLKTFTDNLGTTHKIFQQRFKGVPVEGAIYRVHGKGETIDVINGEFIPLSLSTTIPSISASVAMSSALKFINAKKYKWEDEKLEQLKKRVDNNSNASYYPKGELVISRNILKTGNVWRLSYKFIISALEPESEQLVYVDALNGEILNNVTLLCNANVPGTVETRYSGVRNMIGDSFTGGFRLREDRNSVNVQTLNMQRGTNYASAIDFVDNDNNWTATEHANANRDQAALDAHWGAERVLDYWRTVHNRNSIDGSGLRIISYVHFDNNWDNAQWDGANNVMRYGDGTMFSPLTAIDVCAHEFGHGIDQFESNLTYQSESGALDEGFADIWGAVIENWTDPTKQRWLIGEEIGGPLRSMANPNLFGQPDTRGGTNWIDINGCVPVRSNDWCGVHTNSGVLNYCFFLLSDGGSGTNDLGNAFNVSGIGIDNAARIAYRAETIYLTPNSTFDDARNAFVNSARDLFGDNSCEFISTVNAWFAVGVGAAYSGNGGFSLNGDTGFCTTSNSYSIPNLPAGATVTWSATPTNIVTINCPACPQTTLTMVNDGVVTLTATITNACGTPINVTKTGIQVRFPFTEANTVVSAEDINISVSHPSEFIVTAYRWYMDGVFYRQTTAPLLKTTLAYQCHDWSVSFVTACGNSPLTYPIYVGCDATSMFIMSPNPATDNVTIDGRQNNSSIREVQVMDKIGNLKKVVKYSGDQKLINLNVSGLHADIYYIKIFDGQKWESKVLSVQ